MGSPLIHLLRPPRFEDENKTRNAAISHVILLTLSLVLAGLAVFTDHPITVFVTAGMAAAFLFLWLVMRRGYVNLANWCLLGFLIVGTTLIVYLNGSIRVPAASGFLACIVVAGLTLGNRATIGSSILVSGILFVLYRAEDAGRLPPVFYQSTGFLQWATYAGIICVTAVLLLLARNSILSALAMARRNAVVLEERNQELNNEIAERQQAEHALRESEERYRTLVSTMPDGIVQTDINGNILFASQQVLLLFDRESFDRLIGSNVIDWIAPEDHQRAIENVQQVMAGSTQSQYNIYKFMGRTNSPYAVEIKSTPWRTADGQIGGMISLIRDITSRLRAEQALSESEERYRRLFELESDAILLIDVETMRILDANSAALQLYGYERHELFTINVATLSLGTDETFQPAEAGSDIVSIPLRYDRKRDGYIFPVEITGRYFDMQGRTLLLEAVRDISVRVAAEDTLREHHEQLEELVQRRTAQLAEINHELEAFSYSVAHDLRAPLRAIDGFSRILLEEFADQSSPDMRFYLDHIITASQNMGQLIDALLSLTRLTRSELRLEQVNLSEIAHSIFEELLQQDPGRKVEMVIADGLVIRADHKLMRVVLENLLGNAWKFTAKSPDARIELGMQEGEINTYFVRDNGAGFDMNFVDKLFGDFQRLHSEEEFPGTGIGLATVKRIIHRHNGQVWATGNIDQGATFYFTL